MRYKQRVSRRFLTLKTNTGQTLVEFAMVLPILLELLLGFFDLGRALFYRSSLTNAVREGARAGIVMPYNEGVLQEIVRGYAFGLTNAGSALIITPNIVSSPGGSDALQIEATYCFVPVTPGIISRIGSTCTDGASGITLTATSVMMVFEPD